MNRRLIVLISIFFLLFNRAFAQNQSVKYIEDKYSWYVALNLARPVGEYKDFLTEANKTNTKGGIAIGFLINPYKRKKASTVFYGLEFGVQGDGRDAVTLKGTYGDFYVSNHSYWLNGVVRYRPILWSSKFNPYIDGFGGAKFISSNIVELFDEDESESLEKLSRTVANYGLGIGTGIRLGGAMKGKYLDIGFYFQQTEKAKLMKPNSVEIDASTFYYKQVLTSSNQFQIKIGFTGFI